MARDTCHRFADYAHEVARRFGDRLVTIATHNEPWCTA
jgi:beta-glucosidase